MTTEELRDLAASGRLSAAFADTAAFDAWLADRDEQLLGKSAHKPAERIEWEATTGKFDDIWVTDADIHIEAMGAGEYSIGIFKPDGGKLHLTARRARVQWQFDLTPADKH